MKIREASRKDAQFIVESFSDWPVTESMGIVYLAKADAWMERAVNRTDETWIIGETDQSDVDAGKASTVGIPVCAIHYSIHDADGNQCMTGKGGVEKRVWHIVTHPEHRQKGFSKQLMELDWERTKPDGIVKATFQALPGAIHDMTTQGKTVGKGTFKHTGTATGETGPLAQGEYYE